MKHRIEDHFETKRKITLPGIKEELTMPENTYYRYSGEVDSLSEDVFKTQKAILNIRQSLEAPLSGLGILDRVLGPIVEKLRIPIEKEITANHMKKKVNEETTLALCTQFNLNSYQRAYVIAVKKGLSTEGKIFAEGHESGELLQKIGKKKEMQKYLDKHKIPLNSNDFSGEEFAHIGGLLALKKAFEGNDCKEIALPVYVTNKKVVRTLSPIFGLNTGF